MSKIQIHRSDANQAGIVEAWRRAGASVALIGRPLDALVGWRGMNFLCEIKTPKGALRRTQAEFMKQWRGQAIIIRSVEDALRLLKVRG